MRCKNTVIESQAPLYICYLSKVVRVLVSTGFRSEGRDFKENNLVNRHWCECY